METTATVTPATRAEPAGVVVVDKPVGPTSFEVVARVQRALAPLLGLSKPRALKAGHGGTLDPLASGVLPVCLGEATKLAPFLLDADKGYDASVRFGAETDTGDAGGAVLAERDANALDVAAVEAALAPLRGPIQQVPPMYAAIKHQGRPLYSYARAGEAVDRAPRAVTVFELSLTGFEPGAAPVAHLRVRCSKGTYVRVLAEDLGRALGVGAHLSALRRTHAGRFSLAQAVPLGELERAAGQGRWPVQLTLAEVLADLPVLAVDAEATVALRQGKKLAPASVGLADDAAGRYRLLGPDGALVAVVGAKEGVVRTLRGFGPDPTVAGAIGTLETARLETELSLSVGLTSTRHL